MSDHLDLDALADTLARADEPVRAVGPIDAHLTGCGVCQARLSALRAQSASVTTALAADAGPVAARAAATGDGAGPGAGAVMPEHVDTRITAALATLARPDSSDADTDELAIARAGRGRRRGAWLAVAAAVVLVGGVGVPTAVHRAHQNSGTSSGQSSAASAGGVGAGASAADPTALSSVSFATDVDRLLASRTATPSPGAERHAAVAAAGSTCRRLASATAATALGETAPTTILQAGRVTVDGTPAQLFVLGDPGRQAAVAVSGCSTRTPTVLATGVL